MLRLSWLLLVAWVALSTLLQVAVAPPTLVGYLTAGATPVWLLGSFAVLSLLYRADTSTDPAEAAADSSAEQTPASAAVAPTSAQMPPTGAEVLTERAQAERAYVELSATAAPVSAGQLAAAAGLSASYARALVAQFQAQPPATVEQNGRRPAAVDGHQEAAPWRPLDRPTGPRCWSAAKASNVARSTCSVPCSMRPLTASPMPARSATPAAKAATTTLCGACAEPFQPDDAP